MSKSFREPWYTDGFKSAGQRKKNKRFANKKIRNAINVPNGKAYRKIYNSWLICDYRFEMIRPHIIIIKGKQVLIVEERPWRVCQK